MKNYYIGILALWTSAIYSQELTYHAINPPTIQVSEVAERFVEPNEIFIRIEIRDNNKKDGKTIDQIESNLITRMIENGVSEENIMLSDANSKYRNLNWFRKDKENSERKYQIKLDNLSQIDGIYQSLDGLEIYNAYLSHVNYSETDSIKRVLKREAAKAAKLNATEMIEAVDASLGKLLLLSNGNGALNDSNISVRGSRSPSTYYYLDGVRVKAQSIGNKMNEKGIMHFEKIRIFETVTVKYVIL